MNDKVEFRELTNEQHSRIDCIREEFSDLFDLLETECKPSRETSLAITRLEEALFWAIKGISRE